MLENENSKLHNLTLESRNTLSCDGIIDVDAFNEEEIIARTNCGKIIIKGSSLHIETLELDKGNMKVNGKINAVIYTGDSSKKSFLKRAFS